VNALYLTPTVIVYLAISDPSNMEMHI
jgi:hypothetical protein